MTQATDTRLIRLLNALASDCDDTDGWEDGAPTIREAASRIESLRAEVARLRAEKAMLANIVSWCVNHEGECLGDHPELLEAARTALGDHQ